MPHGGVVLVTGRNGCGKTTALSAVSRMVQGDKSIRVEPRDNVARGVVEGWGAKLTVGRSVRKSGELEIESIDGKVDLAALVDPGIKDPVAADAARIKTLLKMSSTKLDASSFVDPTIVGDAGDLVDLSDCQTDDAVETARRVKKALDKSALAREQAAAKCEGAAERTALMTEDDVEDVDVSYDEAKEKLDKAQEKYYETRGKWEQSKKFTSRVNEAVEWLERNKAPDVEALQHRVDSLLDEQTELLRKLAVLNGNIRDAETDLEFGKKDAEVVREYEAIVSKAAAVNVTEADVAKAEKAAKDAFDLKVAVEKSDHSKRMREMAALTRKEAKAQRSIAEKLRSAAASIDAVLGNALSGLGVPIQVQGERLCVNYEGRGWIPFADQSPGERYRQVIDWAISICPDRGILIIKQAGWDSLDRTNKSAVCSHATEKGVVIFAEQATDGDIKAEPFMEISTDG